MSEWFKYDGVTVTPSFHDHDIVEVEYRDGTRRQGDQPWMFSGWIYMGWDNGRDIVRYRVVGSTGA